MFTGQIIGYVGADARQNKNGKGFNFHVSTKYKNVNNEEQTPISKNQNPDLGIAKAEWRKLCQFLQEQAWLWSHQ